MPEIRVENIVASTSFSDKLDLDAIAQSIEEAEYEPEQFPAVILRIKNPKSCCLIFGSGKFIVTGLKSELQVKEIAEKVFSLFKKFNCLVPKERD